VGATLPPVLQVLVGCDACGDARPAGLYVRVAPRRHLCAACWRAEGEPGYSGPAPTVTEVHQAQTKTLDKMRRRGGPDAYRAKTGKA